MITDKLKSLKGLFPWRKDGPVSDENAALQEIEGEEDFGDIHFSDDIDPEERAKTLRKKAIMITGGAIALFVVTAVAANTFFAPKPEQKEKPLSAAASNVGSPAQGLPSKYSDIAKYQKEADQKNGVVQPTSSMGNNGTNPSRNYATAPTYSNSPRPYSGSGSVYVPTTYAANYSDSPGTSFTSSSTVDKAAEQAEKERQAVINSALAFKVAADVAQGKTPEVTPLANAATPAPEVQQTAYQFSDEAMPESSGNYSLNAGTVIQATLLTGITSDVPNGDVVAQVRQNIYDSLTGTHLLIPQGSRLIGVSGSASGNGNKRIGVAFKRIILPNGASLILPDQKAIDGTGYPGLADIYNDHQGKSYGTAFMSALLGALAQSATGNTSGNDTRSPGQEAVSGAVASILQTGQKMVEKDLNMNPTIEIEPGFQFSVFINQDLLIGEYVDF